jgi:hypothetical protein
MHKIRRQLKGQNLAKMQEYATLKGIEPTKSHVESHWSSRDPNQSLINMEISFQP